MELHSIRLHAQDGPSIVLWVEKLRGEQALLAFKMSCDVPPAQSFLARDVFVLIIQTKYQKEMFHTIGHTFLGLDATHNTTHYENVSLFTLIARDRWGHGGSHHYSTGLPLTHN
jgi:hypothetical protein